jgi:CRISPR system Cascade subunit CasA
MRDHFHLLHDTWIPVRRRSGAFGRIRPCDLSDQTDPAVEIDIPRADLRLALEEFLIGLLTTACPPGGIGAWQRWHEDPPTPEELAKALAPFESAFGFDGAGARFMQDAGDLGAETSPVSGLLIEQPGANTEKNNTDLFQKRGRVTVLARSTAAMTLFALQTFAPSGGAGHRVGLRGGGPMTTLVVPGEARSLWQALWLNTVSALLNADRFAPAADNLLRVFPWLANTRVSDKSGVTTTPLDVHPAQMFWGMPRRIRLDFEENVEGLACDVTGVVEPVIVRSYKTRPYGVNYGGFMHPLSPYYRPKPDADWLPVHPQPGCLAWRNWPNFTIGSGPDAGRAAQIAQCVKEAVDRLDEIGATGRLRIAGFDMDNMKARGFIEADIPIFVCAPEVWTEAETRIRRLVEAARSSARALSQALRQAGGGEGGLKDQAALDDFWFSTEQDFRRAVETCMTDAAAKRPSLEFMKEEWIQGTLRREALRIFARAYSAETATEAGDIDALRRIATAFRWLVAAFNGVGADGQRIFAAANLATPKSKSTKTEVGKTKAVETKGAAA